MPIPHPDGPFADAFGQAAARDHKLLLEGLTSGRLLSVQSRDAAIILRALRVALAHTLVPPNALATAVFPQPLMIADVGDGEHEFIQAHTVFLERLRPGEYRRHICATLLPPAPNVVEVPKMLALVYADAKQRLQDVIELYGWSPGPRPSLFPDNPWNRPGMAEAFSEAFGAAALARRAGIEATELRETGEPAPVPGLDAAGEADEPAAFAATWRMSYWPADRTKQLFVALYGTRADVERVIAPIKAEAHGLLQLYPTAEEAMLDATEQLEKARAAYGSRLGGSMALDAADYVPHPLYPTRLEPQKPRSAP